MHAKHEPTAEPDLSEVTLPPAPKLQQFVYYVLDPASAAIKIGLSQNPQRNFHNLQRGNATELEMIGWHKGDTSIETAIHRQFKDDKIRGEWFKDSKELRAFIKMQMHLEEL